MVDTVLPGARARYLQSRQAQETLHEEFFTSVQGWTVMASLLGMLLWTVFVRQWSRRVIGLTAIIVFVVIANAAATSILSNVEDRYQARVIWLVPLLAVVLVLEWLNHRSEPGEEKGFTTELVEEPAQSAERSKSTARDRCATRGAD